MNTKFKTLAILFFGIILFSSCSDDSSSSNNDAVASNQEFKTLFDQALESKAQTATFDSGTTFTFTSNKGVKLIINGTCLRKNGNPITGNVDLKFVELFDRGEMLTTNKPTTGINSSSEKQLLVSGGEFYINVTQNGAALTMICDMNLKVPTSLSGGTDAAMAPFTGIIGSDNNLSWNQSSGVELAVATSGGTSQPAQTVYNVLLKDFGWFNCDRFYSITGPKTSITSYIPQGYGNGNSAIYIAVKSIPNSLGYTYGQFPVGMECYLIFVTAKDGNFRYIIKPSTLAAAHQVTFTLAEAVSGSEAQLKAALNALP
jgi:hypothetical protein